MRVKHSAEEAKYVDELDLSVLVCTGSEPVISTEGNCHKYVQHMCRELCPLPPFQLRLSK